MKDVTREPIIVYECEHVLPQDDAFVVETLADNLKLSEEEIITMLVQAGVTALKKSGSDWYTGDLKIMH